jgi:iron-sulfur cluster assembly accessory protein
MTIATFDPKLSISVTDTAAVHIQKELSKLPNKNGFRLFLETSGCSGFMYETALAEGPEPEDKVFSINNALSLYVPNKDLPLLNGTEIDFITVGLNSMFQFKNPNVTGECGCGESFSVTED